MNATTRRPKDKFDKRLTYSSEEAFGLSLNWHPRSEWNVFWGGNYMGGRQVKARKFSDGGAPASWTTATDPTLDTAAFFVANMTVKYSPKVWEDRVQIGLRARNMFNRTYYHAGEVLLYPQPKTTISAWIEYKL